MAIRNKRIFGVAVPLSLADLPDNEEALSNLGLNIDDLEIIRTLSDTAFSRNDLRSITNLSDPLYKTFDRYIRDVGTYNNSLGDSGGVDFELRGNLQVLGGISATAFRYTLLDTKQDGVPKLRWGDISTSRVSSWSSLGDTIVYGADVEIGGVLSVGNLKTRTVAIPRLYDSEVATHKIKLNLNGTDRFVYAMKGIPLSFDGYFRNFDVRVDFNVPAVRPSYRVVRLDGLGTTDSFPNHNTPAGANVNDSDTSTLNYRSTLSTERTIEIYKNPSEIRLLTLQNLNIIRFPLAQLDNLEELNFAGNGLTDFPDFRTFAPSLLTLRIQNNKFYESSIDGEERFVTSVADKIPTTIRTLDLSNSIRGGLLKGSFEQFDDLRNLTINSSSVNTRLYADSINQDGALPTFSSADELRTISLDNQDFLKIETSFTGGLSIKELSQLTSINLNDNDNLEDDTFSLSCLENLITLTISRTRLQIPDCKSLNTALESISFVSNRRAGTFYDNWGHDEAAPGGLSDTNFKFANCINLETISGEASTIQGYIPKFINNPNLTALDLRSCNQLVAGRPGKDGSEGNEIKCLYDDNFIGSPSLTRIEINVNNPSFAGEVERNTFKLLNNLSILRLTAAGRFTGDFPDLETNAALTEVSSSFEGWTGTLPSFPSASSINEIRLQGNNFTGSINYSFKNSLEILLVNSNNLTEITSSFNCPALEFFNASENQISGQIPNFSLATPAVRELTLNNNLFDSFVSGSLTQLRFLEILDFTSNNLPGTAIDNILFDLRDNYNLAKRGGVIVNLQGNSPPSQYPVTEGIISGLYINGETSNAISLPITDGTLDSLGPVGTVSAGYFPVSGTYVSNLLYDGAAGLGAGAQATVEVDVDADRNLIDTIGSFTAPGTDYAGYDEGVAGSGNLTATFTDDNPANTGSGATVDVVIVEGTVSSVTLNNPGTGYVLTDIIRISGDNPQLNSPGNDITVPVTTIRDYFFNSATYTITNINRGGSNYQVSENLTTTDKIVFEDKDGNTEVTSLKIDVANITQFINTDVETVGISAVDFLRNIAQWVVQVDS